MDMSTFELCCLRGTRGRAKRRLWSNETVALDCVRFAGCLLRQRENRCVHVDVTRRFMVLRYLWACRSCDSIRAGMSWTSGMAFSGSAPACRVAGMRPLLELRFSRRRLSRVDNATKPVRHHPYLYSCATHSRARLAMIPVIESEGLLQALTVPNLVRE